MEPDQILISWWRWNGILECSAFPADAFAAFQVEKLTAARPRTLAQAQQISGVTPNAASLLMQHLGRQAQAEQGGARGLERERRKVLISKM